MKRGRLPLTALRSFEAAGRHLSFSRAAQELYVSQAAISRQIRELETLVGRPLFTRLHRNVELTGAGQALLSQLTQSFDEIDRRITEIIAGPPSDMVVVSTEPFLANSWLLPRLNRFHAIRPDVDVSVDVGTNVADLRRAGNELAIRHSFTRSSWPGTQSRYLFDSRASPLIAPSLMASGPPLQDPADLGHYTLLHLENRDYWPQWFQAAGVVGVAAQRGPLFPDGAMATRAAVLGQGVTLGDPLLDSLELEAGRLLRPFELAIPLGTYWLVAPDFERMGEPAQAFIDWLLSEAGTGTGKPTPPALPDSSRSGR
ncbi:LysR substrate-binding domain-containing protein [Mesorhizobium marinum]|uniref:LysR substrate-binding domain-containing protein n=1 Tax=Mesorhizobium marinum TaxID=3228790 RepID=UPI003465E169